MKWAAVGPLKSQLGEGYMKIIIAAAVALGTLSAIATTAWAQQCAPGQAVRCTKDFGGGYTCRCGY